MICYRPYKLRKQRSGTALITAMVLLVVIAALGFTVLSSTAMNVRMARLQIHDAVAFNVAESGADRAVRWLHMQGTPPSGTSPIYPFGGSPVAFGDGTYSVVIYPDAGNPGASLKSYDIVSVGACSGSTQTVDVVVRQSSFGKYAYFTDSETFFGGGDPIWFKAGEIIDGPAHSNNSGGSNFNINWVGSTDPIFLDMLTCSGNEINFSPRQPSSHAEYQQIFADGEYGYKLGVDPIALPESTDLQKNAAWGASSGFPSSNGVYVPNSAGDVTAGIYIRGNCTMEFINEPQGYQLIRIVRGSDTYQIRVKQAAAQTQVRRNSQAWVTYDGVVNGSIYCTGNITSLKGEIADNHVAGDDIIRRNAYTVATDVNNDKSITITDDVFYHTKPVRTEPEDSSANLHAGTLGIVGRNVIIDSDAPANLEIDATIMAGGENTDDGSFYVEDYDEKTPTGTLTVLGGIIQKSRGAVGTFSSSTGHSISGYSKDYHYDPRMADNPPPFFPTTGSFDRISWQSQ